MKLHRYLNEQSKKGKRPTIIFSTDLEPDDVMGIYALIAELKQQKHPIDLIFLVGEGNSGIKVLRMQKMIEIMREEGLLDDSIVTRVVQGYGSSKTFELDGVELYGTKEQIDAALKASKRGDGSTSEEHQLTLFEISEIVIASPETFVIGIKPPREFKDLCCSIGTSQLMRDAIYLGSFSFNIRTFMSEAEELAEKNGEDKKSAVVSEQAMIYKFLTSFREMYYFESFFALGSKNSFNEKECGAIFSSMENTPLGSVFSRLMQNWNAHVLGSDPEKIAKYAKNEPARAKILETLLRNWTAETEASILSSLSLETISDETERKKEEDSVHRKIKKWKNISGSGAQFIAADVAAVLSSLGEEDNIGVQVLPFQVSYNDSHYTVLSADGGATPTSASVFVCVPSGTTAKEFESYLRFVADKARVEDLIKKESLKGETVSPEKQLVLASINEGLSKLRHIPAAQKAVYEKSAVELTKLLERILTSSAQCVA